jgi:uncharacterized protein YjbI with pentapeptide repeats
VEDAGMPQIPEFERVDMSEARVRDVDLTGARFERANLSGAVLRGMELFDVQISGEIYNLPINGVDVAPLVNAELDRRFPDRAKDASDRCRGIP